MQRGFKVALIVFLVIASLVLGVLLFTRLAAAPVIAVPSPSPVSTPVPTPTPAPTPTPSMYAFPSAGTVNVDGKEYPNELVDVRLYLPEVKVNLMYAGSDNFTGQPVYTKDLCLLQKHTLEKLKKAQELFAKDGYTLVIYDAYRPLSAQRILYDAMPNSSYIANPDRASNHNRGVAVDVTLMDAQGNLLEMPSEIDTFNITAHRDFPNIHQYEEGTDAYNALLKQYPDILSYPARSQAATDHMNYLTRIMKQCGFTTIRSEWWHFADSDAKQFPATDLDFQSVPMGTAPPEFNSAAQTPAAT